MKVNGITANVPVADITESREFFTDFLGLSVVHPLTVEPWGVRRFFVRAPGGGVINILQHD